MRFQSKIKPPVSDPSRVVWTEPKMLLSFDDALNNTVITFTLLLLKQTLVNNRLRAIDYANVIRCWLSGLMDSYNTKREQ